MKYSIFLPLLLGAFSAPFAVHASDITPSTIETPYSVVEITVDSGHRMCVYNTTGALINPLVENGDSHWTGAEYFHDIWRDLVSTSATEGTYTYVVTTDSFGQCGESTLSAALVGAGFVTSGTVVMDADAGGGGGDPVAAESTPEEKAWLLLAFIGAFLLSGMTSYKLTRIFV